ncbi:MAG: bifunctional diguanylate cyclase/phosphodiesterase [Pseudomonadota bacterium]
MSSEIDAVLENNGISMVFQPIVVGGERKLFGFEALARGPEDTGLFQPVSLFAAASAASRTEEVDFACVASAFAQYQALGLSGLLFVNLTPEGILSLGRNLKPLISLLSDSGMDPHRLVLEITEQAIVDDYMAVSAAMKSVRTLGVAFAIDDLGSGYSGLKAWSELAPEYVKIDRYFTHNVHNDSVKGEFVRAILDMARASRSTVIAEGVETPEEARELIDAGAALLQGYFFGRPESEPDERGALERSVSIRVRAPEESMTCARHISLPVSSISPDTPIPAVAEIFHKELDRDTIPVVQDGRPVGVVPRAAFLETMSMPLRRELYMKRPISVLMQEAVLVVDADLRLEQVSRLVTSGNRTRLHEEFMITERGEYVGMGRVVDLLRTITTEQIQVARYSNPLTLLPGNVPIYDWINRAVERERSFVICHVDVDNFKPFNDKYGYARGDQALVTISEILKRCVSPKLDFVGHVGGDDFVFVFQTKNWRDRIQQCFDELTEARKTLHSAKDLELGHLTATDRFGSEREFELLSISVAALVCRGIREHSAEMLIQHLVPIKSHAKKKPGNALSVAICTETPSEAAQPSAEVTIEDTVSMVGMTV